MADFPPPVGSTARTSRPSAAAEAARSCPGRSRLNPKRSRATSRTRSSTGFTTALRLEPGVPEHPPEVDEYLDVDVLPVRTVEDLRLRAERHSIPAVRLFDDVADRLEQGQHLVPLDVAARRAFEDLLERVAVAVAQLHADRF